jgi:hypothetical protein
MVPTILLAALPLASLPSMPVPDDPAGAQSGTRTARCFNAKPQQADFGNTKGKKLGELPPANLYLTVVREINRCQIPVVIRYGIGR